jgi:putative MATE family efflux protein
MDTKKEEYLIHEPPMKALWILSIPMILGSILQQIYNMADSMIVGRFVGTRALAAVGASSALTFVFICIATGAGIGASVLVSRYFGERNYAHLKQSASTSLISFLILSIILGLLGFIISKPIMSALNTPHNVLDQAVVYLQVYFLGFPFLFLYNILSSMFNALGKSRIPLYLLAFSSAFNIVLDLYMVISLHMGVFGAALATLIAQGISAIVSFILLIRYLQKYPDHFAYFSKEDLKNILSYTVPSVIQQSTVSIGMMLVQSVVNRFGTEALAGFSAAARIENFCSVLFVSIGNAITPFVSQNLGANHKERMIKGYHAGLILDILIALILVITITFNAHSLSHLFLGDEGSKIAYHASMSYMMWDGYFYLFMGIKMATDRLLRGVGDMKPFMLANVVNLAIRVIGAMTLAPAFGIDFVWYPVPVDWFVNFIISHHAYKCHQNSY